MNNFNAMNNTTNNYFSLTRKQKRLKDWNEFLNHEVKDDHLHLQISDQLKALRNQLSKCWEKQETNEQDLMQIATLERSIEDLIEEARFLARN